MDPAESAVVQAALARGFVSAAQLAEAKAAALQNSAPGAILGVLSERYLTPTQREELRAVWREASGHEATRADTAAARGDATLPPPGAGGPGFDTAGATLLGDAAGKAPTAHFLPSGRSASGRFDPTTATLVEGPTPGFDARGATLQPGPGAPPPAQPGYDAMAATIIEPAALPTPPAAPPHDDFRSAHTLVEAPPPPADDFRSANTLVEPGPPRPETTGSLKPEQTEVARRAGEGHTRSDDPRSAPPLSGVSPSLMTRGALDQRAKPARTLPERIGGYRPTRELGRGGMGVVYEALDAADRPVALKVLLGGISASEQAVQRFLIEGKATARMKHKNIVELLYLSEKPDEEGRWYLAMELVRGGSLKERVDKQGPLEEREAVRITIQLADALAFAHSQNVLHRDIKPHNVLLDAQGLPKLTDFGLAKLVGDHQHSLTASGPSVMGTPGFMPPEQAGASNDPPDQRADVYSLGATLFHMLTGRAPFQDESVARVLMAVVKNPPPLISTFRTDISRDLETIVLKCLEKRPGDRYQSAAELRDDLTRLLEEQEIVARRVSGTTRLMRWIAANLAASVGIFLGSAAALTLGAREVRRALEPPPPPPPVTNYGNGGRGWGTAPPGTSAVPGSGSVAWQGTAPVRSLSISDLDSKTLAQITSRDLVKPQLRVMEPKPRQLVNKPSAAVRVFASDEGGVARVALLGGSELKQDPETPDVYVGRWDLGPVDGVKRIAVRVEDQAGNSSQDELIVIVDRSLPTLGIEQSPAGTLQGETWNVVETQVVPRTKVTLRIEASEPVTVEAKLPEGKRLLSEGQRAELHALEVWLEEEKPVTVELVARDEAGNTSAPVFRRLERVRAPWLAGAWWPLLDEQRRAARDGRPVWFKNGLGMRFALVPPGKFHRGGKEVTVSRELYFAETEVTNAQLRAVLDHRGPPGLGGDDQPAVGIDRARVNEYLAALNRDHAQVGSLQVEYRLPTEAEWELACRGFRAVAWWEPLERYAWAEKALSVPTSPVRELQPNPLGLYDLLGNAEEWCQDYFAQTVPDGVDPARADETRPSFVAKGGSWRRKSGSGDKSPFRPEWRFAWSKEGNEVLGFRVVAVPR